MPDTTQKADILFKKSLGLGTTQSGRQFFEEPIKGRPFVVPTQIWTDASSIPNTAPSVTQGIVQRVTGYSLAAVVGTTNSFTGALLQDTIPFNYGDGSSYNYGLTDNLGTTISFGQNDWTVDTEAGILMFNNGVPSNMPPKISFYRYSGTKGVAPSGNYATSGDIVNLNNLLNSLSGLVTSTYATTFNLDQTGQSLVQTVNAASGTLDSMIDILSGYSNSTFATILDLNQTGYDLSQSIFATNQKVNILSGSISSLSGSLVQNFNQILSGFSGYANLTYATVFNLNETGNYLFNLISGVAQTGALVSQSVTDLSGSFESAISGLSGYGNITYAKIFDLNNTGSYLVGLVSSLSGTVTSSYATKAFVDQVSGNLSFSNFSYMLPSGFDTFFIPYPAPFESTPKTIMVQLDNNEANIIYGYDIFNVTSGGFNIKFSDNLDYFSNLIILAKI